MAEGIRKRHSKGCSARSGRRCRCSGSYEAWVYSLRDGRKVYKTFPRESEAKSWRAEAKRALDRGAMRAPSARTLREVAMAWLEGVERGEIHNRSGRPFKPSTVRGYRTSLHERILPLIGDRKLNSITTSDLQEIVDGWQVEGQAPATIRNSLKPLQAVYRRARTREGLALNPTHDLELPTPNPAEVRIIAPAMAARLLSVLPIEDRAIWSTAIYAGLRYGELRALRWAAIDLAARKIRVRESWDPKEGPIAPKTRTSKRTTPMPEVVRKPLAELRARRQTEPDDALVFAVDDGSPFHAASIYRRADRAWAAAGIPDRLRLHQARHTYASFMIAAGVNAKALSVFMGHSSIKVTFDLYGHLMPGTESEAAALLDSYLDARVEPMSREALAGAVP
jgi:integrase